MKNARKHTSFRLDPDVINNIKTLQSIYTNQIGFKVSQSDVITLLVNQELERIEKESKAEFNVKTIDDKPECPNCKGEESPYSVEKIKNDTFRCHECHTEFNY